MNKRGQFFLVATIIIIGIIIGLATVVNSAEPGADNSYFYDLGSEIEHETKQAIDYGVFNSSDAENLTKNFLVEYAEYIAQEEALFIYGNESNLSALHFISAQSIGSVTLDLGGDPIIVNITASGTQEAEISFEDGGKIVVEIEQIKYEFKLKRGKNFYLVIIKTQDDERIVAKR